MYSPGLCPVPDSLTPALLCSQTRGEDMFSLKPGFSKAVLCSQLELLPVPVMFSLIFINHKTVLGCDSPL